MPIKITHCPTTFRWSEMSSVSTPVYVTVIHILHAVDDRYVCTAIAIQVRLSAAFDDSHESTDWRLKCLSVCVKCENSEKTPQLRQPFTTRTHRHRPNRFTNYFMIVYKNLSTMTECLSIWVHLRLHVPQTTTPLPPIRQHCRIENDDGSFQYWFSLLMHQVNWYPCGGNFLRRFRLVCHRTSPATQTKSPIAVKKHTLYKHRKEITDIVAYFVQPNHNMYRFLTVINKSRRTHKIM